jgi:hypothetical protein
MRHQHGTPGGLYGLVAIILGLGLLASGPAAAGSARHPAKPSQSAEAKPAAAAQAIPPGVSPNDCSAHTSSVERQLKLPNGILLAIALVESGQGGAPQSLALSLGQRSVVANSVEDAARRLRAVSEEASAYVGCMQLSYRHHRRAFPSVERMVDPKSNVLYAGRLLRRFHGETGSWRSALARYNGASAEQAQSYVCKIWNHLSELDWKSAKLLALHGCGEMNPPEIAPRTRRAFRQAQVASAAQ